MHYLSLLNSKVKLKMQGPGSKCGIKERILVLLGLVILPSFWLSRTPPFPFLYLHRYCSLLLITDDYKMLKSHNDSMRGDRHALQGHSSHPRPLYQRICSILLCPAIYSHFVHQSEIDLYDNISYKHHSNAYISRLFNWMLL